MEFSSNLFLSILLCCTLLISGFVTTESTSRLYKDQDEWKLFVFGDSYSDTGNVRKSLGSSWKEPYGSTFPGKPAGRFSDGRILTDYLANLLGVRTPLGYIWKNKVAGKFLDGMNFAFGGSGVFFTYPSLPNMTTQIDYFEALQQNSFYTDKELQSAAVLVTVAGNDYAAYLSRGGSVTDIRNFIPGVVNQLVTNLKRLQQLGARKIVVNGLQPLGCLPRMTEMFGYQQCVEIVNFAVGYHNSLLDQAVEQLNAQAGTTSIHILDLYHAFETVITQKTDYQGHLRFDTPLTPCCAGISMEYFCGSVDTNGTQLYTVCKDPSSAFFWDSNHPTQAGWRTVFEGLKPSLQQYFEIYRES